MATPEEVGAGRAGKPGEIGMINQQPQPPTLIRVVALDATPDGAAVSGFAAIDACVGDQGVSLSSPCSWKAVASIHAGLGSLADADLVRDLALQPPRPDAIAAFGSHAWDVLTPAVIGDTPRIDMHKVVRALTARSSPDLPTDPQAILAAAGGKPLMAGLVPQPNLALAQEAEAIAMIMGSVLLSDLRPKLPLALSGSAGDRAHALPTPRSQVGALVEVSLRPLRPRPAPPGPWDPETAWRTLSGEALAELAADPTVTPFVAAGAKAEIARRARRT